MTETKLWIAAAVGSALGIARAVRRERMNRPEEPPEEDDRELTPAELKAADRWFQRELDP